MKKMRQIVTWSRVIREGLLPHLPWTRWWSHYCHGSKGDLHLETAVIVVRTQVGAKIPVLLGGKIKASWFKTFSSSPYPQRLITMSQIGWRLRVWFWYQPRPRNSYFKTVTADLANRYMVGNHPFRCKNKKIWSQQIKMHIMTIVEQSLRQTIQSSTLRVTFSSQSPPSSAAPQPILHKRYCIKISINWISKAIVSTSHNLQ